MPTWCHWLCKALAHPRLGENLGGCQPGLGTRLRSLGAQVAPPPAWPTWERPQLLGGCQG